MLAGYLATASIGLGEVFFFAGWVTLGNVIGGSIFALLIRYSLVVGAAGGGDAALRE